MNSEYSLTYELCSVLDNKMLITLILITIYIIDACICEINTIYMIFAFVCSMLFNGARTT